MNKFTRFFRVTLIIVVFALVLYPISNVHAALRLEETPPEPYSDVYVIYNHPEVQTFWVEIRNQSRDKHGNVTAHLYVRSDCLIAYNLTFNSSSNNNDSGKYLEQIDFLPLVPGHTYDIGLISIPANGTFEITGTKFGLKSDSVLNRMTMVQMSILALHLGGATPPVNIREEYKAIIDSFDHIFLGKISSMAGLIKIFNDIRVTKKPSGETLMAVGEAIASAPGGSDIIAQMVNKFTVPLHVRYTGTMIKSIFDAINVFEIFGNVKRAVNAFQELQNYPDYLTATVTPAPVVQYFPRRYQVRELNQVYEVPLDFKNASGTVWNPSSGYQLWVLLDGFPLEKIDLSTTVIVGDIAPWYFKLNAPPSPGIYHISYQMALDGYLIGSNVPAEIVVVPPNSDDLKEIISGVIDDYVNQVGESFNDQVKELEAKILDAIIKELLSRASQLCGGSGLLLPLGFVIYCRRVGRRKGIR